VFPYIIEDVITGPGRAGRGEVSGTGEPFSRPASWCFGIDPSRLDAFLAGHGLTLCEDIGAKDCLTRYVNPLGRDLAVSEIARIARAVV
jgi:O-methyltransferase involved in polyketide biosynthesis